VESEEEVGRCRDDGSRREQGGLSLTKALEEVHREVLRRVTPGFEERNRILKLAEDLRQKVARAAEQEELAAMVRVEGSVAKDTWLSGEPDIDIFMCVPAALPRETFGTTCLKAARRATQGFKQVERFAEHPYLEATVDGVRVNIVPCYRVERGKWRSATDRTPFHTDYMKPLLDERLSGEVRLLKKFMKGVGVYGAEIRVGGFSGYLCELLTLNYGSFAEALGSAADWKRGEVIDYRGYYKRRTREVNLLFEDPLVVVDPVDKGRNVAAAVREDRLNEFIAAARAFLKTPNLRFFYPPEVEAYTVEELVQTIRVRGSSLVFVRFRKVKAVSDVLWGQLYKSQKSLRKMLQRFDFNVLRDAVWSNEDDINLFIFEVEKHLLPPIKKHLGPPVEKREECEKFLRKHLGAEHAISGPWVEGNRWVVEIQRRHTDLVELLVEKLRDGGRNVGVADLLSHSIADSFEVLVNDEISKLYSSEADLAQFLTQYLRGKPGWLD